MTRRRLKCMVVGLTLALGAAGDDSAGDDPLLVQSRAIVGEFAGRLQAALAGALAEGAQAAAIAVCKELAPQIASELSRLNGARVGRTSLKLRNPINAPSAWQADMLRRFEGPSAASQRPAEYFVRTEAGEARYLRVIRVGPPCLSCHGRALSDSVRAQLDLDYPFDQAQGYEAGDVRGAFAITWPAPTAP